MAANSEIILTTNTHPGDSTSEGVTGDKFKGDGYYGRTDGLHTLQYSFSGFTGTLVIEATLAIDPVESDWFTIISRVVEQETDSQIQSVTGNYVWIRAKILNWTDGTLNSVVLNH